MGATRACGLARPLTWRALAPCSRAHWAAGGAQADCAANSTNGGADKTLRDELPATSVCQASLIPIPGGPLSPCAFVLRWRDNLEKSRLPLNRN